VKMSLTSLHYSQCSKCTDSTMDCIPAVQHTVDELIEVVCMDTPQLHQLIHNVLHCTLWMS